MLVGEAECSCGGFTSGALAAVDAGIGTFSFALASEGVVEREELWLPPLLVLAMRGAETGLELEFASTWAWKRLMSSDARAGRDLSIVGIVRHAPPGECDCPASVRDGAFRVALLGVKPRDRKSVV